MSFFALRLYVVIPLITANLNFNEEENFTHLRSRSVTQFIGEYGN
jgi:hypothetical protein